MDLNQHLSTALGQRRANALYRVRHVVESPSGPNCRVDGKLYTSFCSNDYLGLANHPKVIEAFRNAASSWGVGSGASHLVSGHSGEHHALEEELADFLGRPRALVFSAGYMANMGVIAALVGRGDAIFQDRLNHASLLDGGLLSSARFFRYKHNDVAQLEQRLQKSDATRKLIAVDGVFSMDGDFADLPSLAALAQQNDAWLMVDDAHGIGSVGKRGGGTLEHFACGVDQVQVLVGTLGKAFGTFGAFVSGSGTLIDYLIQFARPYIYTTAVPPAVAAASRMSLSLIKNEPERRAHLDTLVRCFREACQQQEIPLMPSSTPIQPVPIGDSRSALEISEGLAIKGFWVGAIRPPTVPADSARLRITLSAAHSVDQVESLVAALSEVLHAC